MPRLAASAIAVVLGTALLAACGTPLVPGPARDDAEVVGIESLCDRDVVSGGLPADFEPVAVYVCDAMYEFDPPMTTDGVTEYVELPPPERREGDLTMLLAAFAVPSDARWPGPCTAIGWAGPSIWAASGDDRLVRLSYPADGCGMPKDTGIFEALDSLPVAP